MSIQRYGFVVSPYGCDYCGILIVPRGDYVIYTALAAAPDNKEKQND